MKDETMGQEDTAQDAEACAEALESLDRISLDEIAFDDSGVDVQDEPEIEAQPDDQDAKDDGAVPTEVEAGHEESECEAGNQPESDTGEETILLDSLPPEDSLTRDLPCLGSAPAVDETVAMGDIPLPSVPSAREAEVRHRKMSPKRRNLLVAGVVAVALVAGGAGYAAWNGYQQEQAATAAANAHTMMSVHIGVHAAGLDCSAGSKIPVQVSGQDSDGSSVSETLYVDEHGRGIKLLPGDYTLSIAASPIASDGTVYTVPTTKAQVTIKSDGQDLSSQAAFKLKVPSADTVTDDQIDAIMADAGDKRIVVFVNTRSPQPWVGSTNQAIANAATRYKNVRVIDWYGYSANRNDLFDGDGTHLSTTGVTEYLNLIHDAVKKDLPVHPEDHVNDPQPAAVKSATDALVNALALKPHKLGTNK